MRVNVRWGVAGLIIGVLVLIALAVFGLRLSLVDYATSIVVVTLIAGLIGENRELRHRVPELIVSLDASKSEADDLKERLELREEQNQRERNQWEMMMGFIGRVVTPADWQNMTDNYLCGFASLCSVHWEKFRHYELDKFEVEGISGARLMLGEYKTALIAFQRATADFGGEHAVVEKYADQFDYKMRKGGDWMAYVTKSATPEPAPEPALEPTPAEPLPEAVPPDVSPLEDVSCVPEDRTWSSDGYGSDGPVV
ncbi:MAG: hypothetical protein A2566_01330 [Candidatus Zambryskibacteria bacterium RIFOXYD1_FULL_40_13]|nr:MAG: hypothetical protein UT25_C0005G0007 [Parcubacteria group bacterium GW2011_GWC1_39_12]KKR19167.1 MAG: hypothetical protein UT49_C0002G0013 [Parcubacteria group bacterium GW2011_GWF1_39_37]KKR34862.1 MAG: hypothetical protein UT68_C0007G0013 [Parcubacteria group bacterium GW2011_GWC2_40_10]KKR52146.1 MAG: hypothetical protein UT89_C0003G0082 [Parcubacteria group bacterium GW2011_GWE1_40_20]KKR68631.1 MAG: hypothetical protein UU11_C0008G0006 [Parcubacteria group bacterium GW2011_GWF2_40_